MVQKIRKAMPQKKKEEPEKLGLSKFIKKSHGSKTDKANRYVFKGFYERLTSIDVKHSHASLTHQSYKFDHLHDIEDDDIAQSNFIQLLASEKINNPTKEFYKIWREMDNLAFSFPLVVVNKQKILTKLLSHLQNPLFRPCQQTILELLIALVKDLRQEIYKEFLTQMLPCVTATLDAQNLTLLDAVFSFLSFSFKYLLKPIKQDIFNVFNVYGELLQHKNRFVRKFAAQSFSYVLRKVTFTPEITNMLFKEITTDDQAFGVCEILFEVINGGGNDGVHSKTEELLNSVITVPEMNEKNQLVIECLYLKIVNYIDTSKLLPLFEILDNQMQTLSLKMKIISNTIRLKFGKRVNNQLTEFLVRSMSQNLGTNLQYEDQCQITEGMSLLYYFKHDVAAKIMLDGKFTTVLFQQDDRAVHKFFKIMMQRHDKITADVENVDKVLELKQSNQVVEFSQEQHRQKCSKLVKFVCRWTLQGLKSKQDLKRIELLVGMITASGEIFEIEVGPKQRQTILQLTNSVTDFLDLYLLAKFIRCCKDNQEFVKLLSNKVVKMQDFRLRLNIPQNFIVQKYGQNFQSQIFEEFLHTVVDLVNQGYEEQISSSTACAVLNTHTLNAENVQNYLFLTKLVIPQTKLDVRKNKKIFSSIVRNLSKNSRQLRIASLQALQSQFQKLQYNEKSIVEKDQEIVDQYYTGDCNLIDLLLECEIAPISFETEKMKSNTLRKVQLIVSSGFVPEQYLDAAYHFAIGSFWVKFTPLHTNAIDLASEIFKIEPQRYINKHLLLVQGTGTLMQFGQDNESTFKQLMTGQKIVESVDIKTEIYLSDCKPKQDFVQIKDFYQNLIKCLYSSIDTIIMTKSLISTLFSQFTNFMECEHLPLTTGKNQIECEDWRQRIIQSNLTDGEDFKIFKRTSYSKFVSYIELFGKSQQLNKLQNEQSLYLQNTLLRNLTTTDDVLQKTSLSCLMKVSKRQDFDNQTLKLPKYQKLLEGLCDDVKFKDMIPIIAHGSVETNDMDYDEQPDQESGKKKDKTNIPKLAVEDRQQVLPVIVKLLFSKLLKKKGVINKKDFHTRLNIVYQFLSNLDPVTEYPIFFQELLEPIGLKITDSEVRNQLLNISFGQILQFIAYSEVIFKQVGSLLNNGQYLTNLTNILVMMLSQAKSFLGSLREDDDEQPLMYKYVYTQCKTCVRRGLKIIKQLFNKFSYLPEYVCFLSDLFYQELVKDQLDFLHLRYTGGKAQLIEIMTLSWSEHAVQNYIKYPQVMPALMKMLTVKIEPVVFQCHLQMIKNLIIRGLENGTKRDQLSKFVKQIEQEDESMEEQDLKYQEQAKTVLQSFYQELGSGLHSFWQLNQTKLKQALIEKQKNMQVDKQKMTQAVRDLTFIMSELSSYLKDQVLAHSFLEMILSLVTSKQILTSNFNKTKDEELLMFGCQSICNLLNICDQVDERSIDKIFGMFLDLQSRKARQLLANGLHKTLKIKGYPVSDDVLEIVQNLNAVKKGTADIDFDLDKVLNAIKHITKLQILQPLDQKLVLYGVMFLLIHSEFSVREYAQHAITHLLPNLSEKLFNLVEKQLLYYIKTIRDEMMMKSVMQTLRSIILQNKNFNCVSQDLIKLVNQDSQEDFFSQILHIQMPQRLKALRKLQQTEVNTSTFTKAIMPLVDYLIFDVKNQMENRRNTVRYSRDQNNQLQEEALQVYTSYASRLSWGQYMSLVRKLLFKIERATKRQNSVAADNNDQTAEKVVTKCLCKVLDGFNFPDVPDAVSSIGLLVEQRYQQKQSEIVEYSDFLKEFVGDSLKPDEDIEEQVDSDSESEEEKMVVDVEKAEAIQEQLLKKVLPLLQRHLIEIKGDRKTIRSFVAVSIAKVIRKLPLPVFKTYLSKLINHIVTKGLREKEINTREKARKALIKVINEVSPKFLTVIFQEMQNNLNRGFQLHVYLYTVHYVLNHLTAEGGAGIQPGQITSSMITLASKLLLSEMFGDLMEQKTTDSKKKHIKESKAQKAMPIYQVFAQYIDFQKSFFDLIQPIMKVLEENPNLNAVQQTEELLAKISTSLLKNQTVSGDKLLVFLKQIIEKGIKMSQKTKINDERAKRDYGAGINMEFLAKSKEQLKDDTYKVEMKWNQNQSAEKKTQEICGRVLANFGLMTLKKALKIRGLILQGDENDQRQKISVEQKQELVNKLDPFVQPLLDSFKTFYNPIVVQTLAVMINVIHLDLPTFKILLKKFLNRILKLFNGASNSDSEFLNSLFKCTSELIRTYSVYSDLSDLQIKTLVLIIKANVNNFSTQSSVFQCLRSILHRKFQCADLYDLMESVQDLMVTNVQHQTRQTCAQIFLQFIIEYPMEKTRLDQHVNHMLKNLSYFDPEGRIQLLDTLQIFIDRIPIEKLESWTELMFLTLFLRLVNESSTKCRDKVTLVLRKLILKSNSGKLIQAVFQMETANMMLINAKLQLLSLFADVGKLQKQDIIKTVEICSEILQESAKIASLKKKDFDELDTKPESQKFLDSIGLESDQQDDEENNDEWSNTYFCISCILHMMQSCNFNHVFDACSQSTKQDILTLMWRSDNYWVRLLCQKVIGQILKNKNTLSFESESQLLKTVYQMLSVLNFPYVTEELAQFMTQNLVVLVKQLATDHQKVFKKASFIGRKIIGENADSKEVKLIAIVRFFKQAFDFVNTHQSQVLECCQAMLELVCRTYTDEQLPITVRDISTELVDMLSNSLDKDSFIQIFNEVQMQITRARQDRKMKTRLLVGTQLGQVITAKKRIQKTQKKKLKHKEKVLKMSLSR